MAAVAAAAAAAEAAAAAAAAAAEAEADPTVHNIDEVLLEHEIFGPPLGLGGRRRLEPVRPKKDPCPCEIMHQQLARLAVRAPTEWQWHPAGRRSRGARCACWGIRS